MNSKPGTCIGDSFLLLYVVESWRPKNIILIPSEGEFEG